MKHYVVWIGVTPGIYDSWEKCGPNVVGFPNAKFASFDTKIEAEVAYNDVHSNTNLKKEALPPLNPNILTNSISVDGACNKEYVGEYRLYCNRTQQVLYNSPRLKGSTNNIMEFLALAHALAYCKQHNLDVPIYSDSVTALAWVRNKRINSCMIQNNENQQVFNLIERTTKWLNENSYTNRTLKWETKLWGENPADFGNK